MISRLARRYLAESRRKRTEENTKPINKPKGIDPALVKENGKTTPPAIKGITPKKTDIHPKDVFPTTPANSGVQNLVETGDDLSHALAKKVPKDEGYDSVSNLSQYLISTED